MAMKISRLRIRLWMVSCFAGCMVSAILTTVAWKTELGFWFPGSQPGWLFTWAAFLLARKDAWDTAYGIGLVTLGNAVFYVWLSLKVFGAEIASRGRLGRYFVR